MLSIGIGLPITEEPSHTTWHTDRYLGDSVDQADYLPGKNWCQNWCQKLE